MSHPKKQTAKNLLELLTGRRFGIVREIRPVMPLHDEPPLHYCGARIANAHPWFSDYPGLNTGGCGITKESALISALCEGVERYCASSYNRADFRFARYADMPEGSLEPALIAAFSQDQYESESFPYSRVSSQSQFLWIEGKNIATNQKVWAPASAIFVPYFPEQGEHNAFPAHSTGLACGSDYESAAITALCEVIERDALTLTWLKCAVPPRRDAKKFLEKFLPSFVGKDDIRLYDITSDLCIPVFLVVGRGTLSSVPILYVGSACHPDPEIAIQKAIKEAFQDRVYVRILLQEEADWHLMPDFAGLVSFPRHAQFYTRMPSLIDKAFDFLERSSLVEAREDFAPQTEKSLDLLLAALAKKSIQPRIFEISQPWTRHAGLSVVKAVVPELLALHGHHALPLAGHPRLLHPERSLPRSQGFIQGMNLLPHPFP